MECMVERKPMNLMQLTPTMEELEKKPMNILQYMLTPFGLSLRHKSIDYYFTGIVVSVFGLFFITIFLSLFTSFTSFFVLSFKICMLLVIITTIWSYLHLKTTFWKFIAMYDEISHFEHKNYKRSPFTLPLTTFIVISVSMVVITEIDVTLNDIYQDIFGPYLSYIFYKQMPISSLWFTFYTFVVQYLNLELCHKYNKLILFYLRKVKRNMHIRPNVVIKYEINKIIEKFTVNDSQFQYTVYRLNYLLIVQNTSFLLFQILLIILNNEFNENTIFYYYPHSMIALYITYMTICQAYILLKKHNQANLIKSLVKWRDFHPFRSVTVHKI